MEEATEDKNSTVNIDSKEQPTSTITNLVFLVAVIFLIVSIIYEIIRLWPGTTLPEWLKNDEQRFLLLTTLGGALGALVHVAGSFVAFLGNKKLFNNWLPWYIIRPFNGACLALFFYLSLRAGIVTYSPDSDIYIEDKSPTLQKLDSVGLNHQIDSTRIANATLYADTEKASIAIQQIIGANSKRTKNEPLPFNPYGVMAIACMVGMFSKRATQKLKETFETLFPMVDKTAETKLKNPLDHDN